MRRRWRSWQLLLLLLLLSGATAQEFRDEVNDITDDTWTSPDPEPLETIPLPEEPEIALTPVTTRPPSTTTRPPTTEGQGLTPMRERESLSARLIAEAIEDKLTTAADQFFAETAPPQDGPVTPPVDFNGISIFRPDKLGSSRKHKATGYTGFRRRRRLIHNKHRRIPNVSSPTLPPSFFGRRTTPLPRKRKVEKLPVEVIDGSTRHPTFPSFADLHRTLTPTLRVRTGSTGGRDFGASVRAKADALGKIARIDRLNKAATVTEWIPPRRGIITGTVRGHNRIVRTGRAGREGLRGWVRGGGLGVEGRGSLFTRRGQWGRDSGESRNRPAPVTAPHAVAPRWQAFSRRARVAPVHVAVHREPSEPGRLVLASSPASIAARAAMEAEDRMARALLEVNDRDPQRQYGRDGQLSQVEVQSAHERFELPPQGARHRIAGSVEPPRTSIYSIAPRRLSIVESNFIFPTRRQLASKTVSVTEGEGRPLSLPFAPLSSAKFVRQLNPWISRDEDRPPRKNLEKIDGAVGETLAIQPAIRNTQFWRSDEVA